MSFETFPCGSPEAESPEEPAPSLYVENPDEEHARLLIKKPVNAEPSRLAETANIEDQMMSEDEIAQVNASGDALKLKNQETETSGKTKKNIDESERRFVEGSNVYESSRAHWMQLNYGNPASGQTHSAIAIDRQQQGELGLSSRILDADRASVIIKRTSKGQQEVESDSDSESQDTTRKISASELRCDENISGVDANDDKLNSLSHSSRALHYNYNVHHEDVNKLEDKGNAKLQNIRGELIRAAHGEAKAVPVYYMPAGTYPQMVAAMAGGNAIGNTNVLQREQHFVHAGTSEVKRFPGPRVDYVSGRPEQQVPVATSTVSANEGNVFGNLQHGAPGLPYVDRRLVHAAGGYAVVPGIGPVRVIDGMYYRGLPMGGDQSRYENFGSVPSFVPLGNIQTDTTTSQPQAQLTVSSLSNTDPVNNRGQEKLLSKCQVGF